MLIIILKIVESVERLFTVRRQYYLISRLPKYWPPAPPVLGGRTHSPGGEGEGGGVNILEDERDRIALLQ